ncbi:MAG: 30S ribosomal protein S17 [Chloroflexota bacterium]
MNERRRITGKVTSDKMTNTVVVEITRKFRHPQYQKVVQTQKRVKAHDELDARVGDEVKLVESKPISKTVRWVVEEIISRDLHAQEIAESLK